jgi:hypothetical protein
MKFTTFAMAIAITAVAGAAAAQATMQPIPNPPEKVAKPHHKAPKPTKAATPAAPTKS